MVLEKKTTEKHQGYGGEPFASVWVSFGVLTVGGLGLPCIVPPVALSS